LLLGKPADILPPAFAGTFKETLLTERANCGASPLAMRLSVFGEWLPFLLLSPR
jgi:hypothetical protein